MITTQKQLRKEFWRYYPELKRMYRAGQISEKLAERATL